jgi:prepilin-type N-terminal cleavage/methylation domain-containing protein
MVTIMISSLLRKLRAVKPAHNCKDNRGFTLIEVVAVLIITAIIAAVVLSRGYDRSVDVSVAAEVLKNHIRFAQASAIKFNEPWSVSATGSNFAVRKNDTNLTASTVNLPGEGESTVNISTKYKVNMTTTLYFDGKGRPYTTYPGAPITATTPPVPVMATGGSTTVNIIITPDTGFIQ